jgi:hypothetical protein
VLDDEAAGTCESGVTKGTQLAGRRGPRQPDPYVLARPDGRFDVGCRSCRVVIAGLVDGDAAKTWARTHRCTTEMGRPVMNTPSGVKSRKRCDDPQKSARLPHGIGA